MPFSALPINLLIVNWEQILSATFMQEDRLQTFESRDLLLT